MHASKIAALALVASLIFTACHHAQYRHTAGNTWGTTYHITYRSDKALEDSIIATMQQVDMALSPFQPQSVISLVNRGDTLASHPWLTDVIEMSQQVCQLSSGAFDPTLGPLINLWGFGYADAEAEGPTDEQIDSVMQYVGIMDCGVENGIVVKKHPLTKFNFSAIAKGYGVDRIAEMLERNGCTDYLVEVGGEVAVKGKNPRGEEWRVQVDAPVIADSNQVAHQRLMLLPLTDACLATSGNYRNYRVINGVRMGHTISAATGKPAITPTLSASIKASSCALADALATACMAMEPDSAQAMLQNIPDVEAWLVVADADSFKIIKYPLTDNILP